MARKDIGKKPEELDMLLSPSRGLQDGEEDEISLRNPDVQARFRAHIDEKLRKWAVACPPSSATNAEVRKRRDEELGIILLDLRKLREGITSIRRVDVFACEVYEASALLSLFASNNPQLSSTLPHLVHDLHPSLAGPPLTASPIEGLQARISGLSLGSRPPPDPATRAYYLTLHLLHSHLLPAFTSSPFSGVVSTPSSFSSASPPLSSFLPTLLTSLSASSLPPPCCPSHPSSRSHPSPHITFLLQLYTALLRSSYISLSRLLADLPPPPPSAQAHLKALHLPFSFDPLAALLRTHLPALREKRIWPVVEKAYRLPPMPGADQVGHWIGKGLLFNFEVRVEGMELDFGVAARKAGATGSSWEEEEEGEDGWGQVETVRRTEDYVRVKKS
ncbi:hypothetical protein JCM11251_002441 [Rhodosporidiobolus azoricus]